MAITVNGRRYAPAGATTFEHDIWLMQRVRSAGLDRLAFQRGEEPAAFADRLLDQLMVTGAILPIMAGLLVPEGETWSPSVAADTEKVFAGVTDPDVKKAMQREVASVLAYFFATGIASARISPSSSEPAAAVPPAIEAP